MKTILCLLLILLLPTILDTVEGRSLAPFIFTLHEPQVYDDLDFYVDESKPNLVGQKGKTVTYPLLIISATSKPVSVDFHATIDNDQMGPIRFPPGVNIQLEPSQMMLEPDVNQNLNITVIVSDKAPASKYDIKLVGVWKEEGKIPDFMGTSFSLHVGDDFGHDAVPVNFFLPPLKFQKDGVPSEEITCRNNLILILKYDDTPACVKENTKPRLIERGWMKTQVNVFNDSAFIESTKDLDAVQLFLSLHPNAKVSVDKEWFTVTYEKSGFREHPTSKVIHHTKQLIVNLNYEGKPTAYVLICGGPVSMQTSNMSLLEEPDWCFPLVQTQFQK